VLYKLKESILSTWNDKKYVVEIFHDLTKVFDCVNRELLIHRVQFYGFRGVTLD
jgi:hypothetical protein